MSSWVKNITKRRPPNITINPNTEHIPIPTNTTIVPTVESQSLNENIEYDDRSCLDYIDAILYINLAHRTDRNEHILNEIHKISDDNSKIHRIDAIKNTNGALGCGLSHIKTLEYVLAHPEWKTILILEDDFTFKSNNSKEINNKITLLLENSPNMDMALLSHNNLQYSETSHPSIKKILYSQTTSSYIIKREYIHVLLKNMKESMSHMMFYGKRHENCLDIHWTVLQPKYNWYAIFPAIGYQYDNYSDIENRHCTYGC